MGRGQENAAQKLLAQPERNGSPRPLRHSYHRGRNRRRNKQDLTLATWNVRTLLDNDNSNRPQRRTALIASELDKYGIDVAALTETRLAGEGALEEVGGGYTFLWSGLPPGERRLHGVAFAVRTTLLKNIPESPRGVNERIITWRLPLCNGHQMSVICVYAPTLNADEDVKERFYQQLREVAGRVPRRDKLVILGDFNARVGTDHVAWENVLGVHGLGKCNDNGLKLLTFCTEHDLVVTNTLFQLSNKQKTTWKHPRSGQWHILDYVLLRRRDRRDVKITRAMRGADGWTDHNMLRTKLSLHLRPPSRRVAFSSKRLDTCKLRAQSHREALQSELEGCLEVMPVDGRDFTTELLTEEWDRVVKNMMECAERVLGRKRRHHRDWFDEQQGDVQALLEERNKRNATYLRNPTEGNHPLLRETRSHVQRELRMMQNEWWTRLAEEIQGCADTGNQQQFYAALKTAYGPRSRASCPVRSADRTTLITEKSEVLARWAEHYCELLNRHTPTDPQFADSIPELPIMRELDDTPSLIEVRSAITSLKNNKAPGPDAVPAEVLKNGGRVAERILHSFVEAAWTSGCVPKQWKDGDLVSIFKKKGDRAICSNSRGISLLSCAGKILTKIMLLRLINAVSEHVLPESQCGFRKNRSTTDMVFVLRQLQEKCIEQHRALYVVFVDLTKAFDTVNRPLMWEILRRFGCPPRFLNILRALHEDAAVRVVDNGDKSDPFPVGTGVRQGCVIAPVIFNLFLAAVMAVAKEGIDPEDGVPLTYRLDGGLFNLRRL